MVEGFRAHKYKDPRGFDTIGYGFNIDAGISQFAASALLDAQVQERINALSPYSWFKALNEVRAAVFVIVSFNVGVEGLLHFPATIHYAQLQDWPSCEKALLNSDAARELPEPYAALGKMLLTGVST